MTPVSPKGPKKAGGLMITDERLVRGRAARPLNGWAAVFGPGCQPPDPNKPYDISTDE